MATIHCKICDKNNFPEKENNCKLRIDMRFSIVFNCIAPKSRDLLGYDSRKFKLYLDFAKPGAITVNHIDKVNLLFGLKGPLPRSLQYFATLIQFAYLLHLKINGTIICFLICHSKIIS